MTLAGGRRARREVPADEDHKDEDYKDEDYKDEDYKDEDYKDEDYKEIAARLTETLRIVGAAGRRQ